MLNSEIIYTVALSMLFNILIWNISIKWTQFLHRQTSWHILLAVLKFLILSWQKTSKVGAPFPSSFLLIFLSLYPASVSPLRLESLSWWWPKIFWGLFPADQGCKLCLSGLWQAWLGPHLEARGSSFDENWKEGVKERASNHRSNEAYSRLIRPIPTSAPNITKPFSPEESENCAAAKSLTLRQTQTEI